VPRTKPAAASVAQANDMTSQMWLENLAAYSLQVAVLIAAGTALVYLFRLRTPTVLLTFWQGLLAVCLLLPAVQPWRQVRLTVATPLQSTAADNSISIVPQSNVIVFASPAASNRAVSLPTYATLAWILACGIGLRLLWLVLGLLRLNRYLNTARRVAALPESIRRMKWRLGVAPEIFFSADIDSPVTFGWRRPAVLFPEFFAEMSERMQRPIACHELLHVARRDWLFIVFEEMLRSFFWFHPAMWWALGRIHLSREQVVDREVLRITGERGPYLESLLRVASLRGRPMAVPAPLLLRERHLVQRVALMLKESKMTRSRLIFSLVAIVSFLLWTGTSATAWFPLSAPPILSPQDPAPFSHTMPTPTLAPAGAPVPATITPEVTAPTPTAAPKARGQEPVRVGSNVQYTKLLKRVDPVYPELARRARVEQTVMLEVLVDEQGNVANIRVIRGHPLLDQAAIDAVKQWQYAPTLLNGQAVRVLATVEVPFLLSSDRFVSPSQTPQVITGKLGEVTTATAAQGGIPGGAPSAVTANPSAQKPRIVPSRVGGNIQESKLIKRVDPIYPELAQRARVEQIVMLEATVNEEGLVSSLRVIRGHPLLDQAAIDAVKQWEYAPTILNGQAVPVIASVTVPFSLARQPDRLVLEPDGYLKDADGAIITIDKIRESTNTIQITPAKEAPFSLIEQVMTNLQLQGVQNIRLLAPSFTFMGGRLYYNALNTRDGVTIQASMVDSPVEAAILDINVNRLVEIAKSSGKFPAGNVNGWVALAFTVFVTAGGEIIDVQGSGGSMLQIPEIISALKQARVIRPGLRGNVPVPTANSIMLQVSMR
jgi:TonB family protein